MAINAPLLVLTAAGLSVIAKGGIVSKNDQTGGAAIAPHAGPVFKFWFAIGAASLGIILIDQWNSDLSKGLASLWIVGGVVANGPTVSKWLGDFGKGLAVK
jgi:hypothetical protein